MATKNLARTVIEGGRTSFNRFERRASNAYHRAGVREALAREHRNADYGDVVFPIRETVYRCFDDKLAPARRWLGRQVCRPWSKVRSELFQRFDTRTTPGRHIVFDHLLQMVETANLGAFRSHYFTVDAYGILRQARDSRLRRYFYATTPLTPGWAYGWLSQRRVGVRHGHYYWFEPTPFGGFRQGQELTAGEQARYRQLPERFREQQDPLRNPRAGSNAGENSSWSVVR